MSSKNRVSLFLSGKPSAERHDRVVVRAEGVVVLVVADAQRGPPPPSSVTLRSPVLLPLVVRAHAQHGRVGGVDHDALLQGVAEGLDLQLPA